MWVTILRLSSSAMFIIQLYLIYIIDYNNWTEWSDFQYRALDENLDFIHVGNL